MEAKYKENFWDERYSSKEFVYGLEPNKYFKENLEKLAPGKILLLAEGEGRNAVFAARSGWQVDAVDWSERGKEKTLEYAKQNNVKVNYTVADLSEFTPKENYYDAVGLVFMHLMPELRDKVHQNVIKSLKPGGKVIMEVYEKEQINNSSGGPKNIDMLCSLEDIVTDFQDLEFDHLSAEDIVLEEGEKHNGQAKVIRFIGTKSL